MPVREKVLYLTFDDGPHPVITPFVLQELARFSARATFFCIGKNVVAHPEIYRQLIAGGHAVGNHTFHHLKGSKTDVKQYVADIKKATDHIQSSLFRPPYGRITKAQARAVPSALGRADAKIIMWDVLSADFDQKISPQRCLENVLRNGRPGSIIVFHDSEKAWPNLHHALPRVLAYFASAGYRFEVVT